MNQSACILLLSRNTCTTNTLNIGEWSSWDLDIYRKGVWGCYNNKSVHFCCNAAWSLKKQKFAISDCNCINSDKTWRRYDDFKFGGPHTHVVAQGDNRNIVTHSHKIVWLWKWKITHLKREQINTVFFAVFLSNSSKNMNCLLLLLSCHVHDGFSVQAFDIWT